MQVSSPVLERHQDLWCPSRPYVLEVVEVVDRYMVVDVVVELLVVRQFVVVKELVDFVVVVVVGRLRCSVLREFDLKQSCFYYSVDRRQF